MEVPNATTVRVGDDAITVELSDGRTVSVPSPGIRAYFTAQPRRGGQWRLIGGGQGIHWDALDEDVSVENLLAGRRSGESQESYKRWLASRSS
jgi:hypothetical protein